LGGGFAVRKIFIDAPMDALTREETVSLALNAIRTGHKVTHCALNVAKLVRMRSNATLHDDVCAADIVGVDGMGIVWGARLTGILVPERVAGIDLMLSLLEECARHGYRPYFLGATPEVVRRAAAVARARYPTLELAGVHDGYFAPEDEPSIVRRINASGADCLFVGISTPRKERFLAAHRQALDAPFVMGVGGSFDVLAGKVSRAPEWLQHSGLEWAYRMAQEPRRMIGRYLSTNAMFVLLILREIALHPFGLRRHGVRHEQ
jgi:N-acetylglucosaminyldiphosphoundecaprenol N-acetyl-beta-D-mannosaminyltransferase